MRVSMTSKPKPASNTQRAVGGRSTNERGAEISRLMTAHGEAVFGYCLRIVRIRAHAEDVVQQVFLDAYHDLDHFAGRSSPKAWLFGIARNRCLDLLKRHTRHNKHVNLDEQAMLEFADSGTGPFESIDRVRLFAALEVCLQRLPPDVRATVLARFQTGATFEALSRELGASADALQLRVARALPALRRCLERKGWTHE
jgi:RNA polymerase sigma-70 factor (ECF subfamily)